MDNIVDVYRDESYTCSLSQEPVTLAEAKKHCRVDFTDDDDYLSSLISQCRAAIENYCHISIVTKTVTFTAVNKDFPSQFPYSYYQYTRTELMLYGINYSGGWFTLPYGPFKAIVSVTKVSATDIIVLAEGTDFFLRGTAFKQMRINGWSDNVLVVYYAGYDTIPYDLKRAVLEEISFRYDQRGDSVNRYANQNVGISEGARALLGSFIQYNV